MQERTRTIIVGAATGVLVASLLALPSLLPPAVANEEPSRTLLMTADELLAGPIDGDDFVKPDYTIDPWVSTDVVKEAVVHKIGYGHVDLVRIVTTPTGTYSSDALKSPYVRYPGIHRSPDEAEDYAIGQVALWDGEGWQTLDEIDAESFFDIAPVAAAPAVVRKIPAPAVTPPAAPHAEVIENEKPTYIFPTPLPFADGSYQLEEDGDAGDDADK